MPSRNAVLAHPPIHSLEDLGLVPRGEAGRYIPKRDAAPGGWLLLNTNGGGLFAGSRPLPQTCPLTTSRDYPPTGSGMAEQKTLPGS